MSALIIAAICFMNSSRETPATLALRLSATAAMRQPPPSCTIDRSALVVSRSGG